MLRQMKHGLLLFAVVLGDALTIPAINRQSKYGRNSDQPHSPAAR
jgi:hypothetical protein